MVQEISINTFIPFYRIFKYYIFKHLNVSENPMGMFKMVQENSKYYLEYFTKPVDPF